MPACKVIGCTVGYDSNPDKGPFFSTPKDPQRLEEWRAATKLPMLKPGDSICHNHFLKSEVERHKVLRWKDGRIIQKIPYKCARLKKGATPSQFVWTIEDPPSEVDHQNCNHTDLDTSECSAIPPDTDENTEAEDNLLKPCSPSFDVSGPNTSHTQPFEAIFTIDDVIELSNVHLQNLDQMITLPKNWTSEHLRNKTEHITLFSKNHFSHADCNYKIYTLKRIIINQQLDVQVYILGKRIDLLKFEIEERITTVQELQDLLLKLDQVNICAGSWNQEEIPGSDHKALQKDVGNVWRHIDCHLILSESKTCAPCLTARRTLYKRSQRLKNEVDVKKGKSLLAIEKGQSQTAKSMVRFDEKSQQNDQNIARTSRSRLHC